MDKKKSAEEFRKISESEIFENGWAYLSFHEFDWVSLIVEKSNYGATLIHEEYRGGKVSCRRIGFPDIETAQAEAQRLVVRFRKFGYRLD